jgi:hypothetical protein
MLTLLLVKIETVAGSVHEFFYNGLIDSLQNDIGEIAMIRTCDKFGNETKVLRSFHPDNLAALTVVEVDAEVKPEVDTESTEVKWYEAKTP